jgi:hypothetical protein
MASLTAGTQRKQACWSCLVLLLLVLVQVVLQGRAWRSLLPEG